MVAKQNLQKLLRHLHQEVAGLDSSSVAEKQRLEGLISEIETGLENDAPEQHASLASGFRNKLIDFENDHPTASGVIQRLMQTLSDMGI